MVFLDKFPFLRIVRRGFTGNNDMATMLFGLFVCLKIFSPIRATIPSAFTSAEATVREKPPQLTGRDISCSM